LSDRPIKIEIELLSVMNAGTSFIHRARFDLPPKNWTICI